jgi:hypothetical protein
MPALLGSFYYYFDDHSHIGSGREVTSVPPEWNYVYSTHRLHQVLEQVRCCENYVGYHYWTLEHYGALSGREGVACPLQH